MVVALNRSIIYRCMECEEIQSFRADAFKIFQSGISTFPCECDETMLMVSRESTDKYTVEIPCFVCGQVHKYDVSFDNMWLKPVIVFQCDFSGMHIGGVCDADRIDSVIAPMEEDYDEVEDELNDMMGDENKYILLALNIIHEFALKNKVYCTCGSHDICFDLKADSIVLKCGSCEKTFEISVSSQKDLEALANRDAVVLEDMRRSSGKKAKILEFISRK